MMSALIETLRQKAAAHQLRVSATLPLPENADLPGRTSLAMLSPDEPAFWPAFTQSPEWQDGTPDPMDRWSARILTSLAEETGGTAVFPFGGPPYFPFYSSALRSGAVWPSPVTLLADSVMGLFVSFRGGIAYSEALPALDVANPCPSCAQPCTSACPIGALTPAGYDVPRCRAYIATPEGAPCLIQGCAVRRACPVSAGRRLPEQSAWHMEQFK